MRRTALAAAALVIVAVAGAAVARASDGAGTPCQQLPPGVTSIAPPPGFNPRTATPQQLAQYGFPAHLSSPVNANDRTAVERARIFRCPSITPSTHERAR